MDAFTFWLAILAWGLLPGLALLRAIKTSWTLIERTAAAPGLSLALGATAAYLAEAIGLPISPFAVLPFIALLCAAAGFARRFVEQGGVDPFRPGSAFAEPSPRWAPWLIWLLPLMVAGTLEPLSTVVLLPPTMHDGLDHANWFRLIYETRSLDPQVVMAPIGPDGNPVVYPWGMHALIALVAHTTTLDPVAVLMRTLVLISAAAPLSVYAFAAMFVGRGWAAIGSAAFSLMFWWLPYQVWGWGGYPLLAGALAALPVSRLAVEAVAGRRVIAIAVAGLCGVGLLTIHPSQAFAALLITSTVAVTFAAARVITWWATMPFLLALAAAAVVLAFGAAYWGPLGAFLERAHVIGEKLSVDPRYAWPRGVYYDTVLQFPQIRRVGFGVFCGAGAVFALLHRSTRPLLTLHLVFSLLIPMAASRSWVTALWYHAPERIWYSQFASLPILAALGVAGAVAVIARRARGWAELRRWEAVLWTIALLALFYVLYTPFATWMGARMFLFAERNQELTLTDRRVLADLRWIRDHIPREEVLFNAPADWGLPLPFTGHRTVFWSGGAALDRVTDWNVILDMLERGGVYASHAGADLYLKGMRHVYAAQLDPRFERGGRRRLNADALAGAAGFTQVYASPTARIFRLESDGSELLGLDDTGRVQFADGFHGRERLDEHRWRWTNGRGRLRLRAADAADCLLRIFGPALDTFEVRLDGAPLDLTSRGYRIPRNAFADGAAEIAVVSPSRIPSREGTGSDSRRLGVRVRNVALSCAP